ncbi:terminase large subunit domain-containing protein, partial [Propionimicrobium lymphophilum]|uniref:terminase large subunit domain-containing protein n=1 Tax=Propionimicrobium lymphophilum TaxID=33012 RepID=UPI0023EF8BBF
MTEPLTENFLTAGPRLIALLERHFRLQDGQLIRLDEWQKALINHLLECYPKDWKDARHAGRLRYRQAVVSVARQNGKSLLGAAFALWGLLQHVPGASVVGLATSVDQANVVYNRVRYAVDNDPALTRL